MIQVEDEYLKRKLYEKYKMKELFNKDMYSFMNLLKFNKGERLCTEGETMTHFIFFLEGRAKVFNTQPNGKSLSLSFYFPFQVLGDLEFIKEKITSGTVEALTTCYVLSMSMEVARDELSQDSRFLTFICESLANKLVHLGMNASINLLYPLENRLASYISAVSVLMEGPMSSEYLTFNENLTQLSELLGTSYRHLLRILNKLCDQGVLQKEAKGYKVINEDLLHELAGDLYQEVHFL